jgi:thiol-disulfide isomerase/thioredoxin
MNLTLPLIFSMPYRFKWFLYLICIFFSPFFPHAANTGIICEMPVNNKLHRGNWRGQILRKDGHPITFNFQVKESAAKKIILFIINGTEHLLVDEIRQLEDSLYIDMPFFDSHFALRIISENKLQGNYIKKSGNLQYMVPFEAIYIHTETSRFIPKKTASFNISGRWSVLFRSKSDSTVAVGEFNQSGSLVRGTFLTLTGDYRYLDGIVDGDTLRLSAFDGGHAYSFVSKILDTNKMAGFFYSGAGSVETWIGDKNEMATLPDEYSQTGLIDSVNTTLHFKFRDLNGQMVSLSDPGFKNKVVIIQILGSWCPNCMDETRFLSPWYLKNRSRGVEVLGLAYERTTSYTESKRLLQPFIRRFNVTYPILATGVTTSDSLRTEKTLPEIRHIVGFPTTIFIDKKGKVRKIHTGFNGPGTGEHYELYKKEFNELIDSLLAE